MKQLQVNEIRQAFLDYFKQQGHTNVPSSPLVPGNDPTLLFTNAGMVQFKDTFLGQDTRSYSRATSVQRCVRAGGKHNDLENVGYTARHHTFFEMLGNFSFGDYFKREAIYFAWQFLTEVIQLPADKLWVTVFEADQEAAAIWLNDIKIPIQRLAYLGEKSNFWAMGETGPCGPCTEIFYDHGPDVAGGPPGSPDEDGDRYIEIWNLVFMQYNRAADGTLTPLPKPSVDTGMGLERLAAVLQGVHNNYDIDLFVKLTKAVATVTGFTDTTHPSVRVVADHIRSCAFLITDGVHPSNEGRGYVLRRIIRRAVRHGHKLGARSAFFYQLVALLVEEMGNAYPELKNAQEAVIKVIRQEEEQFSKTLANGLAIFENAVTELKGNKIIPGDIAFYLYDTFGFPYDLTADCARERGLQVDEEGFNHAMACQREKSQAASQFSTAEQHALHVEGQTVFVGYEQLASQSKIVALFHEGQTVKALLSGQQGVVILDKTSFYAESGGQVGDTGLLKGQVGQFTVNHTSKQQDVYLHHGVVSGTLSVGDMLLAEVDGVKRDATRRNHSATHLLHAALQQVLGKHVVQKGSLVMPEKLRFDFAHFSALTKEELLNIEALVNHHIVANLPIETQLMDMQSAIDSGAMALFGEKYGDTVRVLRIGDGFSVELCGGTHASKAGDIGLFKMTSESAIAAGVRRIEAVTGLFALEWVQQQEAILDAAANLLKTGRQDIPNKLQQQFQRARDLEAEINQLQMKLAALIAKQLASNAEHVGDVDLVIAKVDIHADMAVLRVIIDNLKSLLKPAAAICIAAVVNDKVNLIAGVSKTLAEKKKASDLVNVAARVVGGKGGGRPEMAQATGNDPSQLAMALQAAREWLLEGL